MPPRKEQRDGKFNLHTFRIDFCTDLLDGMSCGEKGASANYLRSHWTIIRAVGAGLMHGMCTLLVGVGVLFVRKKHKLFVVGTIAMLSTAITYHGIYNMLVQSDFHIFGYLLPITTYIPFLVWRIKKIRQKKA